LVVLRVSVRWRRVAVHREKKMMVIGQQQLAFAMLTALALILTTTALALGQSADAAICTGIKAMHRDNACCAGVPNASAYCLPKQLDVAAELAEIRASLSALTTVFLAPSPPTPPPAGQLRGSVGLVEAIASNTGYLTFAAPGSIKARDGISNDVLTSEFEAFCVASSRHWVSGVSSPAYAHGFFLSKNASERRSYIEVIAYPASYLQFTNQGSTVSPLYIYSSFPHGTNLNEPPMAEYSDYSTLVQAAFHYMDFTYEGFTDPHLWTMMGAEGRSGFIRKLLLTSVDESVPAFVWYNHRPRDVLNEGTTIADLLANYEPLVTYVNEDLAAR
jgi:hypothetical protein